MNKINFNQSSVNPIESGLPLQEARPAVSSLHERIPAETAPVAQNWKERAITHLNRFEAKIDEKMPDFEVQKKIDALGREIEKRFAPLKEFNTWLDSNGQGGWHVQLATFLAKLPLRAARNIIQLLYNIVKGALYAVVHPAKAAVRLAKLIVTLVHELSKIENWAKIGSGMMGASAGQALVLQNPVPLIGLLVGSSMIVGGVSFSVLKSAIEAETGHKLEAVKSKLSSQLQPLPEAALTGFLMGLLVGGIRKAIAQKTEPSSEQTRFKLQASKPDVDGFIKKYNLPSPNSITTDAQGNTVLDFGYGDNILDQFGIQAEGHLADLKIVLNPNGGGYILADWFQPGFTDPHTVIQYSLPGLGLAP